MYIAIQQIMPIMPSCGGPLVDLSFVWLGPLFRLIIPVFFSQHLIHILLWNPLFVDVETGVYQYESMRQQDGMISCDST
jgi:hypothetical protein